MNRTQLINLFEVNGLTDYQLKNTADLLKVFGIKLEEVEGFETLSDKNKDLFSEFILNFYNIHGIDNKLLIEIKSIFFVTEQETCLQKNNDDDYLSFYKSTTTVLDKDLKPLKLLKEYKDKSLSNKEYKEVEIEPKFYLRFDYIWNYDDGIKKEWLHVVNQNEWY